MQQHVGGAGPLRHIERPTLWGSDAVVCDPWHDGLAYLASSIHRVMCKAGLVGLSECPAKVEPVQWVRVEWDAKKEKHVFTTNDGVGPNDC